MGASNTAVNGMSTASSWAISYESWAAMSECPPRSKKSSSASMAANPNGFFHTSAAHHAIVQNQRSAEAPLELDAQAHVPADRFSITYRKVYRELLEEFRSTYRD